MGDVISGKKPNAEAAAKIPNAPVCAGLINGACGTRELINIFQFFGVIKIGVTFVGPSARAADGK